MIHILWESEYLIVYEHTHALATIESILKANIPRAYGVNDDRVFWLMTLYVPSDMRHRGVGRNLMLHIATECISTGCRRINLDDMSDRYNQDDNIYVNMGFTYRPCYTPEMYCSPHTVLNCSKKVRR